MLGLYSDRPQFDLACLEVRDVASLAHEAAVGLALGGHGLVHSPQPSFFVSYEVYDGPPLQCH